MLDLNLNERTDLSRTDECAKAINSIEAELGDIDVLVNNFGWGDPGLVYPEPDSAGAHSVWNRGSPVLSEAQIEQTLQASALKRRTRPEDIAQAVLFLASETTARQVTGQLISVGGGWWMP